MGPKLSIIVEVLRIRYSNTIVRLKLPFGKENWIDWVLWIPVPVYGKAKSPKEFETFIKPTENWISSTERIFPREKFKNSWIICFACPPVSVGHCQLMEIGQESPDEWVHRPIGPSLVSVLMIIAKLVESVFICPFVRLYSESVSNGIRIWWRSIVCVTLIHAFFLRFSNKFPAKIEQKCTLWFAAQFYVGVAIVLSSRRSQHKNKILEGKRIWHSFEWVRACLPRVLSIIWLVRIIIRNEFECCWRAFER